MKLLYHIKFESFFPHLLTEKVNQIKGILNKYYQINFNNEELKF